MACTVYTYKLIIFLSTLVVPSLGSEMLLLTCCWFGSSHHVARARAYRVRVLKGTEQRYVYDTTVRVRLAEMPWMDVAPPGGWRQAARQAEGQSVIGDVHAWHGG